MDPGVYFIHSAALPVIYLNPCVYMSPALIWIDTVVSVIVTVLFIVAWFTSLIQNVSSITKYLYGHSDVFNGFLQVSRNQSGLLNWHNISIHSNKTVKIYG